MQITVRPLSECPQHRTAVVAGHLEQWPRDDTPDPGELLQDTLVLLDEGKPIGSVSVLPEDNTSTSELWVASLWVHPDHRRQGRATRLLREVGRWEQRRPLFLWTQRGFLHRTLNKLGWVRVEETPERQVYMRL